MEKQEQQYMDDNVKLSVLTEVSTFVNSDMPHEQQLIAIVDAANNVLGVKNSSPILHDHEANLLYFHVVTGEKRQQLQRMTLRPGEGIAGWVAQQGLPLFVPDVSKEPRYSSRISEALGFQTRSILCVPIRGKEKLLGAFEVVNRLDDRPFEEHDIPLLSAFASLVGAVLENSSIRQNNEASKIALEGLVQTKATEVEEANKHLSRKTYQFALTTKLVSLINSNRSMNDILVAVTQQLQRLIPVDYATVALLQDNKIELLLRELLPSSDNLISEGVRVPFDESVIKYVFKYKRSIFNNRPRWYSCFLEEGRFLEAQLNTMLCMPIMATDSVLGTLNLGCIEKNTYAKEAVDIIAFIAKQLGVALERQNLRRSLEEVNQQLNEKTFELRRNLIKVGDANLRLFNTQQELREKDKRMKALLHEVQSKNKELNDTLAELKQAQTQLVQSEKMASLGQLVAGIAHELNTPAGAIKAASEIIPDYIQKTFAAYDYLIDAGLTQEHRLLLRQLIESMIASAKDQQRKTTAEIREQSKTLTQQLEERGLENARLNAKDIARCYLENHLDTLLDIFHHYGAQPVMDVLNNCSRVLISSRDNQLSIRTISKIVKALKSYSYLDRSQERTVELNDDIENTLTILHSQIPEHVNIIRKFGEIPRIQCLGSELNQVWTSIIQNALQAIEEVEDGTITIETAATSDHISVKISDNGPGIPDSIKDKIFDPFFTTKRGKTSGLGLSIALQVIDKHQGTITIDSVPGQTTVEIALPKEGITAATQKKKSTRIENEA